MEQEQHMAFKKPSDTCTHHYIYPTPNGPTAFGKCKKCAKVDESKNSIETQGWNNKYIKRNTEKKNG